MPSGTHLFDANVDAAVRDTALSQALEFPSSHRWWPAFMWMQFGSAATNGTDLIPFVPEARLHGLLREPLSLASVADVIRWLVVPSDNEAATKTDTHAAMARWMNANQWTVDESEFYMVHLYRLMQRNLPVDDSPRFQRAESEPLVHLIQTNRHNATAVYAFAMLLRHGEFPVAMNVIDSWLSDERTLARGRVRRAYAHTSPNRQVVCHSRAGDCEAGIFGHAETLPAWGCHPFGDATIVVGLVHHRQPERRRLDALSVIRQQGITHTIYQWLNE